PGVQQGHQQHRAGTRGRRQRSGGRSDLGGAPGQRHGGRVEGRAERGLGRPAGADGHAVPDAGGLLRAAALLPRRRGDAGAGGGEAEAAAGGAGQRPEHGRGHAAHARRLRARRPGPERAGPPGAGGRGAAGEGVRRREGGRDPPARAGGERSVGRTAAQLPGAAAPPAGHRGEIPLPPRRARPPAVDGRSPPADRGPGAAA
ncbi:hypothetical protein CIB84_017373, partial [Bambusicola thoracicus]